MNQVVKFFAAIVIAAGALGALAFFMLIPEAKSAPQEASISAMIMAPVICLYVLARGFEMISRSGPSQEAAMRDAIMRAED